MKRNGMRLVQHWVLALCKLLPFPAVLLLPRYLGDWLRFIHMGGKASFADSYPCLTDRTVNTSFDRHYFFQAAWLARRLAQRNPARHVDVGSDIRMINVLSAFIETEFIDIRPLDVRLTGLHCSAGSVVALERASESINSLSCLHVIEHVGLGRYGDPLDPGGSVAALRELARVTAPNGRLYVSMPVGRERVCFNAHRVFAPQSIINWLAPLHLVEFSLVDDKGVLHERVDIELGKHLEYGCGLFVFEKS